MIEYKLNIGEVVVSKQPAVYTCFGLGSCIGLFLHDRQTGVSGAAHIFLPAQADNERGEGYWSVTHALNELIHQFQFYGSSLLNLRAKVTGGANVIANCYSTGKQNIDKVTEELVNRKVFIAAKDVGGTKSRTVQFHSSTGEMTVLIRETKEYKIY